MKKELYILLLAIVAVSFASCRDKCRETRVVIKQIPIVHPVAEIRNGVKMLAPQDIQKPGKMYVSGNYLYVVESRKGVHVINNTDPANPVSLSFLQIPGANDIDFKGNMMYADSYSDIVSFDISDPLNIKETKRVINVYRYGWIGNDSWSADNNGFYFNEYTEEYVTETIEVDCEDNIPSPPIILNDYISAIERIPRTVARFVIQHDFLYSINDVLNLQVFHVPNLARMDSLNPIRLDFLPFAFFSYKDNLFVPSGNGTLIFNNSVPETPRRAGTFPRGNPCDRMVFQNDIAYVITLKGGYCGSIANRLDLIDISNTSAPSLIKTYSMNDTKALAIDFPALYVCEGSSGLKVFDVTDKLNVEKHLISSKTELIANDVILSGKTVILCAEDGIYQFDGTDPKNLKQLSKIPFKNT